LIKDVAFSVETIEILSFWVVSLELSSAWPNSASASNTKDRHLSHAAP